MKKLIYLMAILVTCLACDSKKSLQEYLVEKENSTEFISASLPTSLLFQNLDTLSSKQNQSLKKIEKINLLALTESKGKALLEKERTELKSVLNQPSYESLLNFNSGGKEAKLLFVGTENEIDELIFFGYDGEMGMLLLRMRGNDVNADDIYQITQSAQQMDVNMLSGVFGDLVGEME